MKKSKENKCSICGKVFEGYELWYSHINYETDEIYKIYFCSEECQEYWNRKLDK